MGKLSLKQSIAMAIANHRNVISIRNDALAFDDVESGLQAFLNKDSGCIKRAIFIKFPFTDAEIEPLRVTRLTELQLRGSKLEDLHALKGMSGLRNLALSENPLNADGMKVIATLTGLQTLRLDKSPVHDSDLHYLNGLANLTNLDLTDCLNLTAPAVDNLRKALPKCQISYEMSHLPFSKGRRRLGAALECRADGQIDDAIALVQKILRQSDAEHSQDYFLISECHNFLGDCYADKQEKERAAAEHKVARDILKANNDSHQ